MTTTNKQTKIQGKFHLPPDPQVNERFDLDFKIFKL